MPLKKEDLDCLQHLIKDCKAFLVDLQEEREARNAYRRSIQDFEKQGGRYISDFFDIFVEEDDFISTRYQKPSTFDISDFLPIFMEESKDQAKFDEVSRDIVCDIEANSLNKVKGEEGEKEHDQEGEKKMTVAQPEPSDTRIIVGNDKDYFYDHTEQRMHPILQGSPIVIVQYNTWKGGGRLVGYETQRWLQIFLERADVSERPLMKSKLPLLMQQETRLIESPLERLDDINEVALKSLLFGIKVQSRDDKERVTEWIHGSHIDPHNRLLVGGDLIVAELRMHVLKKAEFTCSVGINAHSKMSKLASTMNKPKQEATVSSSPVNGILISLLIKKMQQVWGELRSSLRAHLGVTTIGDLLQFYWKNLQV